MEKVSGRILVIDDDRDILQSAKMVLKAIFTDVITENNPQQINYLINHNPYDVILLDMNYTTGVTSGKEGLFWLRSIKESAPDQQVVMITAYGDIKLAVEAMKIGASDFVVKPWENEKLQATVLSAYNHSQSKKEVEHLKSEQHSLKQLISSPSTEIVGNSEAIKHVFRVVDKVAGTDANLLILGENGTGKELVAKEIHQKSNRSDGAFIRVDLGSLSETLFESELFGHKKGAFTDAKENKKGRIELANGGTLFLDEIGNLPLAQQAKLLTTIQSKEILRLGENESIPVNCRIIAATNNDLHKMTATKEFREDLLYRLNTVEVNIPPLRDRGSDIALLASHFLNIYSQKYRKAKIELSNEALQYLNRYIWPGNVRELQHAIERAVIMSEGARLEADDFLLDDKKVLVPSSTLNLDEMEKAAIEKAIKKNHGNISKAAKELGLGRTTIYRKLDKYGIKY